MSVYKKNQKSGSQNVGYGKEDLQIKAVKS